ncbi:ATP-binding protein [Streptomyces sp. NPDC005227]|uniref:ATP-binding protein n=1 Tax=Streptomyces sp. NPDC005227 TaxID=3364707 RepID=UPI0036C63CF2
MNEAARHGDLLQNGTPVGMSADYQGAPGGAAQGRELARGFLEQVQSVHGFPVSRRAMDTVQLVVSELVTNAFRHGSGRCRLDLRLAGGCVRVAVWDASPVLPMPQAPDPSRIGRHGLEIVMAVSRNFEVRRESTGKRVVAAIMLADDPDGNIAGHRL